MDGSFTPAFDLTKNIAPMRQGITGIIRSETDKNLPV
jgi:hypothetical protein